jgi:hypothetical protein
MEMDWDCNFNYYKLWNFKRFTGCIIPDAKSAAAIAPLVLLPLQLFSG